jgi:hypothetical protein
MIEEKNKNKYFYVSYEKEFSLKTPEVNLNESMEEENKISI